MFKILIPVDFTSGSINACRYALQLAAAYPQAEILLLHCFRDYLLDGELDEPFSNTGRSTLSPGSEEATDRVLHRNQSTEYKQLEELYTSLQGQNIQIERQFVNGSPEDVIPDQLAQYKPDLLVMGTKGDSDFSRTLFGTITTKMVDNATVPLLTVPENHTKPNLRRVLYATDFDKTDAQAITMLQQLLQPLNTGVLCVHIGSEGSERKDNQKLQQLQQALQAGTSSEQDIQFVLLEGDDVAEALKQFVAQEQIGLIAVNNQQRSLLSSILHPSLTKKLVLEVQVPMLIFHSPTKA
ncbi:universal stress protein [Pontibacter rugosus]|uniref:Universal stress protein n=1 Tax=Pontibacter rugosus TaxID=1745966 RepID=A0ABW3SN75_9BACT